MRLRYGSVFSLISIAALFPVALAIWPFPDRHHTPEGWINGGSLGLDIEGHIAALGDWDGDQYLDLFVLDDRRTNVQIQRFDPIGQVYRLVHELSSPKPVENIIPADFNQDGRLDILLLSVGDSSDKGWWAHRGDGLIATLHLQEKDGSPAKEGIDIEGFTQNQPIVVDADGDLKPDLLGMGTSESGETLQMWKESNGAFERYQVPLEPAEKLCRLAVPHSNAFVDLDGDCLADLFLMCEGAASKRSFQVWKNRKNAGFHFAGEWDLPAGSGAVTFADMDRDGTIDLVFPTCSSVSTSTGIGRGCSLNIAYNKQKPLCSSSDGSWLAGLSQVTATPKKDCRRPSELCTADEAFTFDLSESSDSFTTIPVASLFPGMTSLLFSEPKTTTSQSAAHIPLRIGDYNIDGFPDILALVPNNTAAPSSGGIFGGGRNPGVQVRILENVGCRKKDAACQDGKHQAKRRQFRVADEIGMSALLDIWDVKNAAWLDVGEDGTLDVMIERTGKQDAGRVTFIRNNAFHDAFFLKAVVLDGACQGDMCVSASDGRSYSPYGSNLPGANFKFTILDTAGNRVPAQIPQMPQTAYRALQAPYSLFGLGRTNNYIEKLFIGSTKHDVEHYTTVEGVIPNSHIVINPPLPVTANGSSEVRETSSEWHKTLYLQPGKWMQWVVATATGIVLILAGVTYMLHNAEKREDELERRKTMHRINFAAFG